MLLGSGWPLTARVVAWPDGVCCDGVTLQRVDWLLMAAQRALLQLMQASWDGI